MVLTESFRSDLFQAAFTHSAIGMALVGLDGSWLEVNRALCDILGYEKEELTQLTFQDITHPDDLEEDVRLAKQLLFGEIDTYRMEKRYVRKDGTNRWTQLTGSLARDASGAPDFFIAQVVDISRQKEAQVAQGAFFDLSPDLLCVIEQDGCLVDISKAWTDTLGWTRRNFLSRPLTELIHPDDLDRTLATLRMLPTGQTMNEFTNRCRHMNGAYRWLQWNGRAGDNGRIYAVVRDITARKASEERHVERRDWDRTVDRRREQADPPHVDLRQLSALAFESSTDCVKILDMEGQLLAMNKNGQGLMGIASIDDVVGTAWRSFWPEQAWPRISSAIESARSGKPGSFIAESPKTVSIPKWWDVAVSPIFADNGAVQAILVVSRDITANKEESLAIQRAQTVASGQRETLEHAAAGASLPQVLDILARTAEAYSGGEIRTSILLLDDDGEHLRLAAAPSFPESYHLALATIPVAAQSGNCALAVQRKRPVFVRDTLTDPIWDAFRHLAVRHELRSCWSQPIISSHGTVLGTFVFYYSNVNEPSTADLQTLMVLVNTASLVLERNQEMRQRVETEAALRKSEAQFRKLVESGILGILHYHNDGTIKKANDAFLKTISVTREDFEKNGLSCKTITPPEWHEADRSGWGELARSGVLPPFEKEFFRADGSRAAIYLGAAAFEDNPEEGIAYVLDISGLKHTEEALRESEAKFRIMTNAMPQMVWSSQPDGYHDYFNEQWYAVTGMPPGSTDGDGWTNLFHPDDQERTRERWQRCLATGQPYEIEYRLRQHTGEYRWVLGRALPVRDEDGKIMRWMGTCTDIHEHKTAREALEQSNERKNEFLAILAHELRNPLAPITAAAQYLSMTGATMDEEKLQRISGVISRQTRQMTMLIDDLLDVSRVSRGTITLESSPVSLVGVIHEALEQLAPQIALLAHAVEADMPPHDPIMVSGDHGRLVQVVVNLIGNAVKYTPKGGRIRVHASADQHQARFVVEDNGIGMSEELVRHAFDLFTQGERSSDRMTGGLGIGLALVRSLVSLHGGNVTATSEGPSLGSRFVVTLPLLQHSASSDVPSL